MKRLLLLPLCVALTVCGGGGATTPTPPPGTNPNTFTITAAGVTPKELTVALGTRVLFVNNDSRRHHIASDPHPEHSDCREIDAVMTPGQSRETGNLNTVRTCGFHDHDLPNDASLQGRIVIR